MSGGPGRALRWLRWKFDASRDVWWRPAQERSPLRPWTRIRGRSDEEGYHAYLTRSHLAGEEWVRLRIGFFKDTLEALRVGDEVKVLMNMSETPMPVKIDTKEFERFAVY